MEKLSGAIVPPAWANALPRAWFAGKAPTMQSQPWFDVYDLGGGDYALCEGGHFQEVISFLLIGTQAALLWDTGMGIGDMRKLVRELTDLPLLVVNSHTHFDHMGGNHLFEGIHVLDCPAALERVQAGLPADQVAENMPPEQFARETPDGFVPADYAIRPAAAIPIKAGHVFDLGGKRLTVMHTPGHSPDSIMLLDEARALLLTGDTFYPATLYAHFAMAGMASDFGTYRATMRHLATTCAHVKTLYTSHNEPVVAGAMLAQVADGFDAVAAGMPAQIDEEGLHKYQFDGFAIVTGPPSTHRGTTKKEYDT